MNAGVVLKALKTAGSWVLSNTNVSYDPADIMAKLKFTKKDDELAKHLLEVDEKLNQLGSATLELDEKLADETASLHNKLSILNKQMQNMKIITYISACIAIVAVILALVF